MQTSCETTEPVFGAKGEIAYGCGTAICFLDGRRIPVTGLPTGAEITDIALSPTRFEVAALAQWGGGFMRGAASSAVRRLAGRLEPWVAAGFHPADAH